ncbi:MULTISPECIES: S49 family peptidase [Bacteroidales]|uniref:S49 family peptidase n=1 Tax=Bacteroidales TaxID=171549 RepID=UPI0035A1686B
MSIINLKEISKESLDLVLNPSNWLIDVGEFYKAVADIIIPRSDYSYSEECEKKSKTICQEISGISLVSGTDLSSSDVPEGSLAYYRVSGLVRADYPWDWYFSSKRMVKELLSAESNPNISAHFIHLSSGGGEAWYLDRLFETLMSLDKPVFAHVEKVCASAAYYIGCTAQKISVETPNCTIGSIGVMCQFTNMAGLFEKLGIKDVQLYADGSDLKNKKIMDALYNGNPDEFIKKELNPIRDQFVSAVRSARPALATMKDDHPAMRGEDYRAEEALQVGLVDSIETLEEALSHAYREGLAYLNTITTRQTALTFLPK